MDSKATYSVFSGSGSGSGSGGTSSSSPSTWWQGKHQGPSPTPDLEAPLCVFGIIFPGAICVLLFPHQNEKGVGLSLYRGETEAQKSRVPSPSLFRVRLTPNGVLLPQLLTALTTAWRTHLAEGLRLLSHRGHVGHLNPLNHLHLRGSFPATRPNLGSF